MFPQRIKVYKYLAEQKYATVKDIYHSSGSQASLRSFRVCLYQFGLSRFSYPGIPQGIWHIQSQDLYDELYRYYPQEPLYKVWPIRMNEIEHALGMNRIRRAIEKKLGAGSIEWWSEHYLKALPPVMRHAFSYLMIPDAMLVWNKPNGEEKVYFVEYERTLKSASRYRDIFRAYLKRNDVTKNSIVYVCRNERIRRILKDICRRVSIMSQDEFQFIDFDGLCDGEDSTANE